MQNDDTTLALSVSRRRFLKRFAIGSGLVLLPGSAASLAAEEAARFFRLSPGEDATPVLFSFGLMADTHYGDFPDTDRPRFFRSSLDNMSETAAIFNDQNIDLAIHLGDVIQEAKNRAQSTRWLQLFDERFQEYKGDRYYVMGNHDLRDLTKTQFLNAITGRIRRPHYFFDKLEYRFIILDANFRQDGRPYQADDFNYRDTWIPADQFAWLSDTLDDAKRLGKRVIVCTHQTFDATNNDSMIKNAPQVRQLFEEKGNVAAVFYGHRHAGGYFPINGVNYIGIVAGVNGPDISAAIVRVLRDGRIIVFGRGRQPGWPPFQPS